MSTPELLTFDYKAQLVLKHQKSPWGGGGWTWVGEIADLIVRHKVKGNPTVLDYGAGRRTFSSTMQWAMPHVHVREYDPGVPAIDKLPAPGSKYDFVLCTDVLEHVEEQFVEQTLKRLREYSTYATMLNIACTPSKSLLPDGRNAHITVKPPQWWHERIGRLWLDTKVLTTHKNFTLIATV